MSVAPPPSDPEVAAEQTALEHAASSLVAMRTRAPRGSCGIAIAAGNPDLEYVAALSRRVSLRADSPRPLLFGRIDEEEGPTWRIGRRHVEDTRADPVVVDWRAPVAVPFYRASAKDPLGLSRRRQIMVDRGSVVAVADDLFGGSGSGERRRRHPSPGRRRPAGRARAGPDGRDARHRRHHSGRAGRDHPCPAGPAPHRARRAGTGKTAVGLHRAAFLFYNHPELSREGVLVLGPSRAFLRYIAQVLPSLGEEAVVQTTIADIAPRRAAVRGADGRPPGQGGCPHGRAAPPCPGGPAAGRRPRT